MEWEPDPDEQARPAASGPRRFSLRNTLTMLIGGLIILVIGTYSWAAYQSVRQTVVEAANARLSGVSDQIAASLETSVRQMRPILRTAADKPAFRAYLRAPGKQTEAAALAALREPVPNAQQLTSAELWTADRRRLLVATLKRPGSGRSLDADEWAVDSGVVGRLHDLRDSLVYPAVVPVTDAGKILGYLVQWRGITGTPETQQQYSKLIGANAGVYIGNDRGDIWTDLAKEIEGPPIRIQGVHGLVQYDRPGQGSRMAYVRPIRGLPWILLLEFSSGAVLSTANAFVRHVALLAGVILALGLVLARILSRGISGPIEQLTAATEKVATGDISAPVSASRHAELGRLADAFNTMVRRVGESQQQLENRVAQRTRELQERNEELEAFGYSISHDLRGPLRAMQGFSQIILDDYGEKLDAEGRRYAGKVVAAATRMDQLIRDLLAYSRISREHLAPGQVNLSHVVKQAVEQIEAELQESGAQVRVQEPLPAVVGHAATLAQVIANLVGNGVKFVPPGRVPEVTVRAEPRDGLVRLWVEDNGIGILAEHQERIFGVFERLHSNEAYPGTGIGLAIVRKGVERMGGRVGVESTPEVGSRFWIDLPTQRAAA